MIPSLFLHQNLEKKEFSFVAESYGLKYNICLFIYKYLELISFYLFARLNIIPRFYEYLFCND